MSGGIDVQNFKQKDNVKDIQKEEYKDKVNALSDDKKIDGATTKELWKWWLGWNKHLDTSFNALNTKVEDKFDSWIDTLDNNQNGELSKDELKNVQGKFNDYIDNEFSNSTTEAIDHVIKMLDFELNSLQQEIKEAKVPDISNPVVNPLESEKSWVDSTHFYNFQNKLLDDLAIQYANDVKLKKGWEDKDVFAAAQHQKNKIQFEEPGKSILENLPTQSASQEKILQDTFKKKNYNIAEKDVRKKVERQVKEIVVALWNGRTPEITPNQIADKLYYEYTGAILSAEKVDIQFATAYKLEADANDSNAIPSENLSTRKEWKRVWKDLMTYLNGDRKFKGDEKRLMKTFVELVIDLENNVGTTNNKNIEKVVLDSIAKDPNAALWNTEEDWIETMKENGIVVENHTGFARMFWAHGTKALQQIAQAYIAANNINGAGYSQFPWFRRFTNLIREYGSFEAAYQAFDQQMEETKTFTKKNKKRTERFNALTIQRGKYVKSATSVDTQITMLADFNLDGNVNYADTYNKTGLQFREMMQQGNKGKNIDNLITAFNQGKGEENKLTKEAIFGGWDKKANLENFTALQDFVKAPPIDLNLIIRYGADALTQNIERAKEQIELKAKLEAKAKEAAEETKATAVEKKNELANKPNPTEQDKMQMKALEQFLSLPNDTIYHGLKDLLEWQLANMTQNGAGLAVGVSLDKVLEWLSFNLGWANNEDWTKGFGVNLSWNGTQQLWERGGVYGWVSAGTVLLTVPIVTGNIGVYHVFENKNRNDSLDTDRVKTDKVVNAGAHAFTVPWLAGRGIDTGIDTNRRDAVESKYRSLLVEGEKFWNDLLDAMTDNDTNTFTYNVDTLKNFLEKTYPKTKDFDKVIKNIEPLLQFYSGQKLDTTTKAIISQNIIESYATTWKNEAIHHLDDKGWYLSGGGLSVTFLEGIIPVVGILKFKKHRIETSADNQESMNAMRAANEKGKNNRELKGNLNTENIKKINTTLWKDLLSESTETNGTGGANLIKIDMTNLEGMEIRIDPAMKGLMKKDSSWNILIHPDTPVRAFKSHMNDAQKTVLNIGDNKSEKSDVVLKDLKDVSKIPDYFVNDKILAERLPSTEKVELTEANFNKVKKDLLAKLDEEDRQYLDNVNFSAVTQWQDLVISVDKNGESTLSTQKTPENKNFSILMNVEGKDTVEDEINVGVEAQQQIDDFYAQMPKITSNVLANIAHTPNQYWLWNLSSQWRTALKTQDFATAKTVMITMLPIIQGKVNKYESIQNKVDFSEQVNFLKNEQNTDTQKRQLLLALDGMFSRTRSVRGKTDHYELNGNKSFENITTYNKNAITQKMLSDRVDPNVVAIYKKMFHKMNEQYKTLNAKDIQTESLTGVAYNFGNGADNERPIYNPKIVAWSLRYIGEKPTNSSDAIKSLDLSDVDVKKIKLHTAEQMINEDKALIQPLIDKLNISLSGRGLKNDLSDEELITLIATWKLEKNLDNGKKIIINSSYNMMVALFAQCINHMVVAQDLKFQVDWKNVAGEDKNISAQLKGERGNVTINAVETDSAYTTTTKNFQVAAAVNIKNKGSEDTEDSTTPKDEKTPENTTEIKDLKAVDAKEVTLSELKLGDKSYSIYKIEGKVFAQVDGKLQPVYKLPDGWYTFKSSIEVNLPPIKVVDKNAYVQKGDWRINAGGYRWETSKDNYEKNDTKEE